MYIAFIKNDVLDNKMILNKDNKKIYKEMDVTVTDR